MATAYVIRHPDGCFTVQDRKGGCGYAICSSSSQSMAQLVADALNNHAPFMEMRSSFEVSPAVAASIEYQLATHPLPIVRPVG